MASPASQHAPGLPRILAPFPINAPSFPCQSGWGPSGAVVAFSAKTEYGLIALLDLATAHPSGALVQTGEICRRHAIPERYLEQMLTTLRKGGHLRSIRGPRGGFQLSRPPEQISVADVEACLEGDASPERKGDRQDAEFQALEALDRSLEEARRSILRQTTLADLLRARDRFKDPSPMFYI